MNGNFKMNKITFGGLVLSLGLLVSTQATANDQAYINSNTSYKVNMANSLQQRLLDPAFKQKLLNQLSQTKAPMLFSNAMSNKMSQDTQNVLDIASTKGIYPEVWLHTAESQVALDSEELLIAYAPAGDENEWQYIPAIHVATGEALQLDVAQAPQQPVLVVETHGSHSMQRFVADLNAGFQQLTPGKKLSNQAMNTANVDTTKLTKISLQNDQEPWIKGGAEIFSIVAGVFAGNEPSIQAVELPYLDDDNKDYYPNQLFINWSNYDYNAVNFSMYEEDSEANYKELAKALVTAVGAIGSLAGYPQVAAIAEITNRIQDAMPDSWYTDDHDYVDTCYTIVKGESLTDQWCAAGNAKISTQPFTLQAN